MLPGGGGGGRGGLRSPDPHNLYLDTPITIKFGTGNKNGN